MGCAAGSTGGTCGRRTRRATASVGRGVGTLLWAELSALVGRVPFPWRTMITPVIAIAPPTTARTAGRSPSHSHETPRATTGTRYSADVVWAMSARVRAADH